MNELMTWWSRTMSDEPLVGLRCWGLLNECFVSGSVPRSFDGAILPDCFKIQESGGHWQSYVSILVDIHQFVGANSVCAQNKLCNLSAVGLLHSILGMVSFLHQNKTESKARLWIYDPTTFAHWDLEISCHSFLQILSSSVDLSTTRTVGGEPFVSSL